MRRSARRPASASTYLAPKQIEAAALRLIGAYAGAFEAPIAPPVPVEEILECHLSLDLDFNDLSGTPDNRDVLGALWVTNGRVAIDESLDPDVHPTKEGRYRFTVAHEVGHWELHRQLYLGLRSQSTMFEPNGQPSVVCRAGDTRNQREWQANQFAAYLLMPRQLVLDAWESRHGSLEPYIAVDEVADLSARWCLGEDETPTVAIARELAGELAVSGQAMQIRLLDMGLIRTTQPEPSLFA